MPVTPNTIDKLRATADEAEAVGYAALEAGDRDAALKAFQKAQDCRFFADRIEANPPEVQAPRGKRKTLSAANQAATVQGAMSFTAEHRMNMSKTRAPRSKLAALARKLDPPLMLQDLADKAGISKSTLTLAEQGKRPMPTRAAEKIQALTGYPVSAWRRLS